MLGAYAINGSIVDLVVLVALGALGFGLRRFGYPIAPAVVGLVLGPMAEEQLRRTLAISQGDVSALGSGPFAIVVYSVPVVGLGASIMARAVRQRRRVAV